MVIVSLANNDGATIKLMDILEHAFQLCELRIMRVLIYVSYRLLVRLPCFSMLIGPTARASRGRYYEWSEMSLRMGKTVFRQTSGRSDRSVVLIWRSSLKASWTKSRVLTKIRNANAPTSDSNLDLRWHRYDAVFLRPTVPTGSSPLILSFQ